MLACRVRHCEWRCGERRQLRVETPALGHILLGMLQQLTGILALVMRQVIESRLVEQIGAQRHAGWAGVERKRRLTRCRACGVVAKERPVAGLDRQLLLLEPASGRSRARCSGRRR